MIFYLLGLFRQLGLIKLNIENLPLEVMDLCASAPFRLDLFGTHFSAHVQQHYTYNINIMQNPKSTENQKNQQKTFFQPIINQL